jgi:protein TonB
MELTFQQPDRPAEADPPMPDPFALPDAAFIVPTTIPPIVPGPVWDPTPFLQLRMSPGLPTDARHVSPDRPDGLAVLDDHSVDERPELITAVSPVYPDLLRQAGIEGSVLIEVVIDTAGRAEAATLHVVRATNGVFAAAAREAVLRSRYRPGRVNGHPVRVLVQVPIAFDIR